MNKVLIIFKRVIVLLFVGVLLSGCGPRLSDAPPATSNKTALRIHQALPSYAELSGESWPRLQLATIPLKPGSRDKAIPAIRRRLALLGDASSSIVNDNTEYSSEVASAVERFQWRHGLKPDGEIGYKTLKALNVSPAKRLVQLQTNMAKWAKFPEDEGSHYIRVNIPSFNLDLIRDGNKIMSMKAIVGHKTRKTPVLYSKIETLVFNPKWQIPRSIAKKDIIPRVLENPNYLAEQDIKIFSSWRRDAYRIDPKTIDWKKAHKRGFPYRFTQAPGDKNALGQVKFIFMNKHDVYLHDTPQKGLFDKIQRSLSSGCIRVEKPFQLVEYFFQQSPALQDKTVSDYLGTGKIEYVKIRDPIPIYLTYITAWVDENGVSHFREDIYRRERQS